MRSKAINLHSIVGAEFLVSGRSKNPEWNKNVLIEF